MAGFGGAVKLTGESEYRKALQQISQNLKEVSSEMRVVSTAYDTNDKSVEALNSKAQVLNKTLSEQTNRLEILKAQYSTMSSQFAEQTSRHQQLVDTYNQERSKLEELGRTVGTTSKEYQDQLQKVEQLANEVRKSTSVQEANEKSMSRMRVEINNAQADCNKTAKAIDDLGKETKEAGEDAQKATEGFTVFKGVLANLASTAIMEAVNGLKKLATSMVNVGKSAYSGYAQYEQLVGGVETLFGESSEQLIEYANVAYKTAGISANKYMEQATSFSATLLQGLKGDTEKAVEYANMAIIDMSDNANKMGTDMAMIQNAYQGFAKDNYTMLDNLKLGYGGTAGEMARLINDSGVLGKAVKITAKNVKEVPFDKMIEAIHVIQQQIGITGTTTLEAEHTIEGSTKSMLSAWQNLVVGIADGDQDISPLIDDLTDQIIIAGKNAIPRVKQIIKGMAQLIKEVWTEALPEIASEFPMLEPIIGAFTWISENASALISAITGIATAFATFKAVGFITTIVSSVSGLFNAIKMGIPIVKALNLTLSANPIGLIIAGITGLVAVFVTLWNTSEDFRNFWINLWDNIKTAFVNAWNNIKTFVTVVIPNAFTVLKDYLLNGLVETYNKVNDWAKKTVAKAKEMGKEVVANVVSFVKQLPSEVGAWLSNTLAKVGEFAVNIANKAKEGAKNLFDNIVGKIKGLPSEIYSIGRNIVSGLWNGINSMLNWVLDKVRGFGQSLLSGIKRILGIASPSKVFRDEVGKYLAQGIGVGFEEEMGSVAKQMQSAIPTGFDVSAGYDGGSSVGVAGGYDSLVVAFKEALSQMKIELDDEVAGHFVEQTVTRIVYA